MNFPGFRDASGSRFRRRQLLAGAALAPFAPLSGIRPVQAASSLSGPMSIYINWGAYDELSDNVPLTEKLAMAQFDELLRLRKAGARFDCYLMDCFWFDEKGSYRKWRSPNFSASGGQRWLAQCKRHGINPGLWVGMNANWGANAKPVVQAWKDSHDPRVSAMSLFSGGFLGDFMQALQNWYDQGVRIFKFDFADFSAAPDSVRETMTPAEIRSVNELAFMAALGRFRQRNAGVVTLAYNGFGGRYENTFAPLSQDWDQRWLRVFDALYCGDPRFSDVPMWNWWRSMDLYSDYMVHRFHRANDIPLSRIDSSGFMIAKTGTGYHRGKSAFRGMLVLSLARGGWANTYYGNLDLLNDDDAHFFGRAQALFLPLQALGQSFTFGPSPGEGSGPYGFASLDTTGGVFTVVNPTQKVATLTLPQLSRFGVALDAGRILFRDAGYVPTLSGNQLTLGPEQMVSVGFGRHADAVYDLGEEPDVIIPRRIDVLPAQPKQTATRVTELQVRVPQGRDLRVVARQKDAKGRPVRTTGGPPPNGRPLGAFIKLAAARGGDALPMETRYDRVLYSGLSWGVGTVAAPHAATGTVDVRVESLDPLVDRLEVELFAVER